MTNRHKRQQLGGLLHQPKTLVARLLLGDLIAKRGEGPLQRKLLIYKRRKR